MSQDLSRLLRPGSIAVIGGGWGLNVVEQCRKAGFGGEIWPVHPSRADFHGIPCFPSIEALPGAPDAAYIAVNRSLTVAAVAALAARGCGGAICFASGFRESVAEIAGGADLETALVAAAGAMPILGPNCYGLLNYLDGATLWPDQHGGARCESGVAMVTQSSNMLINLTMQARGLPLAYCVAAGNQAQTDLAEIGAGLIEDPRVTALGLHIEGIRDIRALEAVAARARALEKPIVALKVGASEEARAATVSHTASLAGSDAASRSTLARLGIGVVETVPAFLETLKLLHLFGPLPGTRLGSVSCSGGEASLMADAGLRHGIGFRKLTRPEHDRIKATLSEMVAVANPLDYHTFIWGDGPRLEACFTAMAACGFDLCVFVLDFPRNDRASDETWEPAVAAIIAAARTTGSRVAVVASMAENLPEARAAQLMDAGVLPVWGIDETMVAMRTAHAIHRAWQKPLATPLTAMSDRRGAKSGVLLDEYTAKRALAAHGLPVPHGHFAETPEAAGAAQQAIGGPVALKGLGVAHKTEAGAVRLGLESPEAVAEAAAVMQAPEGYLVEAMVEGALAELILGVTREAPYGFMLTIGAGGVMTEILADTAHLMIPASAEEIDAALSGLKIAPLLAGFRGRPAADRPALLATVMALQDFVIAEAHRLIELDINPLIVTASSVSAADALIRVEEE